MATIKQAFKKRIWECAEKYKPTYQISYMENKDMAETEFAVNSASAKAEAIARMCGSSANYYCGEECAYEKAIEIVKAVEYI